MMRLYVSNRLLNGVVLIDQNQPFQVTNLPILAFKHNKNLKSHVCLQQKSYLHIVNGKDILLTFAVFDNTDAGFSIFTIQQISKKILKINEGRNVDLIIPLPRKEFLSLAM